MEKNTALDLFLETNLRHLYQAERKVHDTLTTLAKKSTSPTLEELFLSHIQETDHQIERLDKVFLILDIDPSSSKLQGIPSIADQGRELIKTLLDFNFTDKSSGINGIIAEGKEMMRHFVDTDCNDMALIGSAYQVEAYEASCYQLIIFLAELYEQRRVAQLMEVSYREEKQMGSKLLAIARSHIELFPGFARV